MLTINFGPHHPATHGVLRLLVTLEGEVVRDLKPFIGYVHTGIEKNCEDKSYWKVIPLVERMDYLAYYFNSLAFCMCVERLLDEAVPERAQYLRVIHCELNRIHSHLVWLGTSALISARSRSSGTASASATRCSTCSRPPRASACTPATSRLEASSRTSRPGGVAGRLSSSRHRAAHRPVRVDARPQRDLPAGARRASPSSTSDRFSTSACGEQVAAETRWSAMHPADVRSRSARSSRSLRRNARVLYRAASR